MPPSAGEGRDTESGRRSRGLGRRAFLAVLGGLGFTIGGTAPGGRERTPETPESAAGTTGRTPSLPLPASAFVRGAARDAIPAIDDPVFAPTWDRPVPIRDEFGSRTVTLSLADFDPVLGVVSGGEARAYPLRVLAWHEVVNDRLPDREGTEQPILVTYCPLCGSGVVARRTVDGHPTTFGVSGLLYRDNLVLYDEATGSLWSQLLATAVRGPATGARLELLPVTLSTWAEWRRDHPGTTVLLPPPHSGTVAAREAPRNYGLDPYAAYRTNDRIGFGEGGYTSERGAAFDDDRLHPKTYVLGVAHGGIARAYPLSEIADSEAVNDNVGGLPIVVTRLDDDLLAYDRRIGGRPRAFEHVDDDQLRAAGSLWAVDSGVAVDGARAGERLQRVPATGQFWFAWLQFHPETSVWGFDET